MNIITSAPILHNGKRIKFSNAGGDKTPSEGKPAVDAGKDGVTPGKKKQDILDKAGKAKGWFDKAKGIFGHNDNTVVDAPVDNTSAAPSKKGMTTQTKVLIGVGIAGLLGIAYYMSHKKAKA